MKTVLAKKLVVLMLFVVMIATAGVAMAESAETRTQTKSAIVNGTVDILFAHPHNKNLDETKEFSTKYLSGMTPEEQDAKYQFTLEADEAFRIVWNDLKYTDGSLTAPNVGVQVISADADGKSVKITMSLRETGEAVHVMEYVYDLKGERALDIQCSGNYTHEFVSGMGEVLTVAEGSDLTITLAHQGIGEETLNMSYDWIDIDNGDALLGTENTMTLTDIRSDRCIACIAKNGADELKMVFFEIMVEAEAVSAPVWNGFEVNSTGKYDLNGNTLYVEKNAQVMVTASYIYEGSSTQQIYWNFNNGNGWQALESKTADCTFTFTEPGRLGFTLNDNGAVIDEVLYVEEFVPEPETVTENFTWELMLNGLSSKNPIDLGRNNYLKQNFFNQYAIEDLTITTTAGKGISDLTVKYTPMPRLTFTVNEQADGEIITVTVVSKDGNTYIANYQIKLMSVVRKESEINTESGAVMTKKSDGDYEITVKEGTSLTVTANYELLTGGKPDMTYEWGFLANGLDLGGQNGPSNSYTFTVGEQHNNTTLEVYVENQQNPAEWDSIGFELVVLPNDDPTPILKPITLTVRPIGGDQGYVNGTKYLYVGETVPFVAQASYEGEQVELSYSWYLETRDASGNVTSREQLPCTESTYNLTAAINQAKKYVTCYVEGAGLEPASYSIKLGVTYRTEGDITLNVQSSHPVVNDVLTVTEGETVTLTPNPSSPLQDAEYGYMWFLEIRDENGETIEEEKLDYKGGAYSFVANADLNGKYIYCSVYADRLRPGSFCYQLKVEPKSASEFENAVYFDVVQGGKNAAITEAAETAEADYVLTALAGTELTLAARCDLTGTEEYAWQFYDKTAGYYTNGMTVGDNSVTLMLNADHDGDIIDVEVKSEDGTQTGNFTILMDVTAYQWNGFGIQVQNGEYYTQTVEDKLYLYAEKGSQITVTAQYTCTNEVDRAKTAWHVWKESEQKWKTTINVPDTYTFIYEDEGRLNFSINENGTYPINEVLWIQEVEAMPTLSVSTEVIPADENGVITVTEGEEISITAHAVCSDENVKLSYKWYLNGERIELPYTTTNYAFVPTLEQNGAEISVVVTPNKAVEPSTPTHYEYVLNVQAKTVEPVEENFTWELMLNGLSGKKPIDLGRNNYLNQNFFNEYAIEDLTITTAAGKGISDLAVTYTPMPRLTFSANEQADGEIITVTVVSKDGNTYIANYQIKLMSVVRKEAAINTESGAVMTKKSDGDYEITVKEGTSLTVTANYELLTGGKPDMTYEWGFLANGLDLGGQTGPSNSYTFTVGEQHNNTTLEVYVENQQNPAEWDSIGFELSVEAADPMPTPTPAPSITLETRTENRKMLVNGNVDILFAHPHNKRLEETKEFETKYLSGMTPEEQDAKYQFTLEADEAFRIVWNDLKYTDGSLTAPNVGVQVISADADGKSVKITMSLRETGEVVHVMEYAIKLTAERSLLDIQCSGGYTHEFVSGMGEVVKVADGSDLTITVAHKGIGETLNMSYDWIDTKTDEPIGSGNMISLTDIRSACSIACIAKNGSNSVEMIFFEIDVDASLPATTPTPVPTATPTPTATPVPTPTPTVEVKVEDQTEEQKQNQTVTVVVPDDTVEEAIQNAQSNVVVFPVDQAPVEEELSVTTAKASASAFEDLAESNKAVSIPMSHAEVVMQPEVIEQIAASAPSGSEIEISVEQKKPQEALNAVQQQAFENQKVAAVITADVFMKEGEKRTKVDFNGKVTLKVPFTPPAGESGHDYVIVFVADNGQVETMATYYTNGHLVFETTHFSDFVITTRAANTNVPVTAPPKTGDNAVPFLWLMGMSIAVIGCVMLNAKRRQHS